MTRPSAKSIYMQRKEYAESITRQPDSFHYRVEHLFTWELDGKEVSTINDCVAKLKSLDSKGKVWGQDLILQVQARCLQLCDIEAKEVLESLPLSNISQTKAILDSCVYNSLLTVTVQGYGRRPPNVFLFQCEETGAEEVRRDLERAIQQSGEDAGFQPAEMPMDIRSNLENIIGQGHPRSFRRPGPPPMQHIPPAPENPPHPFGAYQNYEDELPQSPGFAPRDEGRYSPDVREQHYHAEEPSPPPGADINRSLEIFNHVVADVDIFMEKVGAALKQQEGNKKKKKKQKSVKDYGENFPPIEEYAASLQKIKYAFNLLGKLKGHLNNPGAPDFVHSLFSSISFLVKQFPPAVPPSILSPLLTESALELLSQVVNPEEEHLWSQLGDSWKVPRSNWPNAEQIPPYIPVFYDGWQPPMPVPPQSGPRSQGPSRSNSQRFPDRNDMQGPSRSNSQRFSDRNGMQQPPAQVNRPPGSMPARPAQPLLPMRVIYDFTARNRQELSVMKGEVVQVVDKSRQWWVVRNSREEEGHVPPNVLEPMSGEEPARTHRAPNLDMRSSPEEVTAWLQYKGFSRMTVRSLGVMNGALLLGMKPDDLRAICPEEGGRVFFQLQAVKSAQALASESGHVQYGGR
ncbi:epidermal growth factor receptor kinase substrate 8-like protein 3b isoform X2 [Brachyhypopomus gauderio]